MALLGELGHAARRRRLEMGLSQQRLADIVDLSRATINELETGKLKDLSARRVERLANELGFAVGLLGGRGAGSGSIDIAARIASVPYASALPPHVLLECLRTGVAPPGYLPHMRALLEEAPVKVLADVAEELEQLHGIARQDTWKRLRTLAASLGSTRPLWVPART